MIRQWSRLPWVIATLMLSMLTGRELLPVGAVSSGYSAAAQELSGEQMLAAIEDAFVEIIARNERSIVSIARVRQADAGSPLDGRFDPFQRDRANPTDPDFIPNEFGTGVVVGADGLILTAYHVLSEAGDSEYYITTVDRQVYQTGSIWAADPRSDLAVLKVDATDLEPIKLGDATTLRKGHIVIALGNPYAIARDGQVSASWGIVSNLGRKSGPQLDEYDRPLKNNTLYQVGSLIQTDAKLNLGTSGGALLNRRGEMVGLTTSLAALAGYEQAAGFAVPVDETFRRIVETLKQGREVEYGFLGVQFSNLRHDEVRRGLHGARITSVLPGTPADRFGLESQDLVTAVDGEPIYDSDALVLMVGRMPVEEMVRLTVLRDGRTKQMEVELAKYPVRGKKIVSVQSPDWRGLRVDYATAVEGLETRIQREPAFAEGGVVIVDVDDDSPAYHANLRPGMLVTHVGNVRVQSPREFRSAVAGKTGPVQLRFGRTAEPVVIAPADPDAG